MKNKLLVILLAGGTLFMAACNGDHSTRVVRDTVKNTYGADTAKVEKSNLDTGKISSTDNSASGGTKSKDSTKQIAPKK